MLWQRLGAYGEHPEAKFLGHDGMPCQTRGLLRRMNVIAERHRYIGKETSRRWEHGDDLSLVDFLYMKYRDGKAVASKDVRNRIVQLGIRKVARETGIHTDTIMLITRGQSVKVSRFAKVVQFIARK